MTPSDRIRLALELGERDLALFRAANPELSRTEAIARLQLSRQAGRRSRSTS